MLRILKQRVFEWLTEEKPSSEVPLCDFERIRYEVRPGDVLLTEGRSRLSEVIKQITQSSWSHSCLYIGRIHDIDDLSLRAKLAEFFNGDPEVQLVIEGYLGRGTIVSPLENYQHDHIRICRPRGLLRQDAQKVVAHAINQLGRDYDVRQIFDLARLLVPWSFLPRRWRSSLFQYHTGPTTRTVCSTMIAEAFSSIDFPILPVAKQHEESGIELYIRNPRLFTPRDFDYSPFFEIIKYPFLAFAEGPYRNLPWNRQGLVSHDGENILDPAKEIEKHAQKLKTKTTIKTKSKKPSPEADLITYTEINPLIKELENPQSNHPHLEQHGPLPSEPEQVCAIAKTETQSDIPLPPLPAAKSRRSKLLGFISQRFTS